MIANTSSLRLIIPDFPQVEAHGAGPEGVVIVAELLRSRGRGGVVVESGTEAADEGVKAPPRLAERAGARAWGHSHPEVRAGASVDLGFPELVEVSEEFEHVGAAALAQRHRRRPLVLEVLDEGYPVAPLLVLVSAAAALVLILRWW